MKAKKLILAIAALGALGVAVGVAVATHVPQVDPATVPPGFLATHNNVERFSVRNLRRAVRDRKADIFVQHIVLGRNAVTPWHTHPGPVIVTVVRGVFNYQFEDGRGEHAQELQGMRSGRNSRCVTIPYRPGEGFVDPGFGHVHRAFAGPDGADAYATYVLPSGSPTHIITDVVPPLACT